MQRKLLAFVAIALPLLPWDSTHAAPRSSPTWAGRCCGCLFSCWNSDDKPTHRDWYLVREYEEANISIVPGDNVQVHTLKSGPPVKVDQNRRGALNMLSLVEGYPECTPESNQVTQFEHCSQDPLKRNADEAQSFDDINHPRVKPKKIPFGGRRAFG